MNRKRMYIKGYFDYPRHLTTSGEHILKQLIPRAADRSLLTLDALTFQALVCWTILSWERKVPIVALERMGVRLESLRSDVDRVLIRVKSRESLPADLGDENYVVDYDQPIRGLVAQAQNEADLFGHTWIATEHLLLAILRSPRSELVSVFQRHDISYDSFRDKIREILGG